MLKGQPVTAVIPARGGSKGIPGKNLRRIGRDTLLERAIKQALRCSFVDRTVVSTDDPEMHAVAERYDVAATALRPAHLATDTARTVDVLRYLIEAQPITEGWILLLQTTSPLRTLADFNALGASFERSRADVRAMVSLVHHESPHPDKIQTFDAQGMVTPYAGAGAMLARQSLPAVYALNGAFYLTHRDVLLDQGTFIPAHATAPFIMPEERSVNLDHPRDLLLLEYLLEKGLASLEEYE